MLKSEIFFNQQFANRFMSMLVNRGISFNLNYRSDYYVDEYDDSPCPCIEVTYDDI